MKRFGIDLAIIAIAELSAFSQPTEDFYAIKVTDIDGNERSMDEFRGKVLLIVNVASKCGFTPQYEGLESLYKEYADQGLTVLGFPSNDFLWQEPGSDEEIKSFCTLNYGVTFPMFSKVKVNGRDQEPLYAYLTSKETDPEFAGKISWNFNKFLIDRQGNIVARFDSSDKPLSDKVVAKIKETL